MANYTIIGGDAKEYGLVTEADIRQWLTEGRLNAQSLAKADGDAEFRPLAQFPELAAILAAPAPAPSVPPPASAAAAFSEGDYDLDIGGCLARGWDLLKQNFGTVFAACLIMLGVEIAFLVMMNLIATLFAKNLLHSPIVVRLGFNYFFSAVGALVMGPLMGGLFLVYLKTIRQQATSVGEVFAGFQRSYGQLFLGALVVSLIVGACMLPFNIVWQMKAGPLLEQLQQIQNDPTAAQKLLPQLMAAMLAALPVFLICVIPVTYLTVCWQFTLPLIIDRQLSFNAAMKTSFKQVNKHWWPVFGVTVLAGLVTFSGFLGCCIGVLFTAPIGLAALMFAYETIFGAKKA